MHRIYVSLRARYFNLQVKFRNYRQVRVNLEMECKIYNKGEFAPCQWISSVERREALVRWRARLG